MHRNETWLFCPTARPYRYVAPAKTPICTLPPAAAAHDFTMAHHLYTAIDAKSANAHTKLALDGLRYR